MQNKTKKYNSQTGCYKIDIFKDGCYVCSTDQSKTCKEAKIKYLERNGLLHLQVGNHYKAKFFYQ